jgi:methionine-rich copper-binding protein CopC
MWKAVTLALAVASLATASADAHARLIRAQPRVGSTVAASPTELRLLFSESLEVARSSVTLTDSAGRAVALGPLSLDPANHRVAVAPIQGVLSPGVYRVKWDVTSTDTHSTYGDFTFRLGR